MDKTPALAEWFIQHIDEITDEVTKAVTAQAGGAYTRLDFAKLRPRVYQGMKALQLSLAEATPQSFANFFLESSAQRSLEGYDLEEMEKAIVLTNDVLMSIMKRHFAGTPRPILIENIRLISRILMGGMQGILTAFVRVHDEIVNTYTNDLKLSHTKLETAYHDLQVNQEKLLIAEKMASLGRLTAGIAHEMNTPIAAVRAANAEIKKLIHEYQVSVGDPQVTPADHQEIALEMEQAIQLADRAAERAASFVYGIKAQTRDLSSQERRHFKAVPVIQETLLLLVHALRRGKCEIDFAPAAEELELYGSAGWLSQVVTNLVNNAIDASAVKGGGPICIRLSKSEAGLELQVTDQGCGISAENLPKIFDPMFTTKPFGEGTGLGLTIVHDIVTANFGGTIEVDSQVGQGTSFTIHFPRSGEE